MHYLINHLLVVDVKKRYKAEEVLCHPWIITQGNSKEMPPNLEEYRKELLNELKMSNSTMSKFENFFVQCCT